MIRFLLLSILLTLLFRALARLWAGVVRGVQGGASGVGSTPPRRSVQMSRDPVCGTFVVPERAVALTVGGSPLYFCSTECRDQYRGRADTPAPAHGRPA